MPRMREVVQQGVSGGWARRSGPDAAPVYWRPVLKRIVRSPPALGDSAAPRVFALQITG